mmetsp:Transcript_33314/g.73026  ORF Transcript_33314/g.73026 Transcript_33314/m.73026 type:complete len:93 (+) Transcript_33314:706-984(+)
MRKASRAGQPRPLTSLYALKPIRPTLRLKSVNVFARRSVSQITVWKASCFCLLSTEGKDWGVVNSASLEMLTESVVNAVQRAIEFMITAVML